MRIQTVKEQRDIATETTNINSFSRNDSTPLNQGTSILDTKLSTNGCLATKKKTMMSSQLRLVSD